MALAKTCSSMPQRGDSAPAHPTFHLFCSLPPELRLKIWTYNLPESRVVSVQCGSKSPSLSLPPLPGGPKPGRRRRSFSSTSSSSASFSSASSSSSSSSPSPPLPWCTSPAVIPANLHVCHESRAEALRRYTLMFGIARQTGHVYFDADCDVLYFGPRDGYMASEAQLRTMLTLANPDELARVRRVALNEALFWEGTRAASTAAVPASTPGMSYPAQAQAQPAPPPPPQPQFSSSAFQLAASTAVDVLQLLRARLPGLREVILVPRDENPVYSLDTALIPLMTMGDDSGDSSSSSSSSSSSTDSRSGDGARGAAMSPYAAATTARLSCQIEEAIRRMHTSIPNWSPPQWNILALSGDSSSRDTTTTTTTATASCSSTVSSPERAAPPSSMARTALPSLHASLPPLHNSRTGPAFPDRCPPYGRSVGGGGDHRDYHSTAYHSPAVPLPSAQGHPLPPPCNRRHQRLPSLNVVFPHVPSGASGPPDPASFRGMPPPGGVRPPDMLQFWELDE